MPEPIPRRKVNVSLLKHRLAMINLAIENNRRMESFVPPDHQNHTPRATHALLVKRFGKGHEFWIMLGGDVFEHIDKWQDSDDKIRNLEHIKRYSFLVGLRTEDDGETAVKIRDELKLDARLITSYLPAAASSVIRRQLMQGQRELDDLSPEVEKYVIKNGLYGTADRKGHPQRKTKAA